MATHWPARRTYFVLAVPEPAGGTARLPGGDGYTEAAHRWPCEDGWGHRRQAARAAKVDVHHDGVVRSDDYVRVAVPVHVTRASDGTAILATHWPIKVVAGAVAVPFGPPT